MTLENRCSAGSLIVNRQSSIEMVVFWGALTAAGGLFLFLWYRTVVSLPIGRQPPFIYPATFKWGIPIVSVVLFALGLYMLSAVSFWFAGAGAAIGALAAFLLLKYDRYSAEMRVVYDHYRNIRQAHPDVEEVEVLFHTARWRYPNWSHDRVVELVAGKDIRALILLMMISENKVNPISDWELYRSLKEKSERLIQAGK